MIYVAHRQSHAKKVALFILFSILYSLFSILLNPLHAQSACDPSTGTDPVRETVDKINDCAIERNIYEDKFFTLNQLIGTTDALYNLLTGVSQLHPETDTVTGRTGALAATGSLVATLYSRPPASGVEYFAREIQELNPIKPAYAQAGGIGFAALEPVQAIWKVFRNASYIGFVLVFVIIGFMVMFRAHISPQAVATVQDSLPRIVIALFLVTFSYALAGLMVDLMFLTLNIIINLLQESGLLTSQADIVFKKSVFGVTFKAWQDIVSSVADAIANLIDQLIKVDALNKVLGFFGGGLAGIIAGIAILVIMFRIFMMLLASYVMIIILTMFSPFIFLIQALPGNNGAKEWFKQMAANVAVFPTVALMFIFAGILGGLESLGGSGTSEFTPQQIGQFPLLAGDLNLNALGKIIGFGFLMLTPQAAELVRNAIGAKGVSAGALGGAIMAGVAAGYAPVGAVGKAAGGAVFTRGPIGTWRREQEARRSEEASIRARKRIFTKPPKGLGQQDVEQFGVGYKKPQP